jgi:hypothetical protein
LKNEKLFVMANMEDLLGDGDHDFRVLGDLTDLNDYAALVKVLGNKGENDKANVTSDGFDDDDQRILSEMSDIYQILFRDDGGGDLDELLKEEAREARMAATLSGPSLVTILVAYSLAAAAGAGGNALVLSAILSRPSMRRSSHNLLLAALACSDLFLCTVTLPLALWELQAGQSWPLGADGPAWQALCKVAVSAQALPIFASTFAIAAISIDRYRSVMGGGR